MESFLSMRKTDWLLFGSALIFTFTIMWVGEVYSERPSKAQSEIFNNAQQCLSNNAIETCLGVCEGFSEKSPERNACVCELMDRV